MLWRIGQAPALHLVEEKENTEPQAEGSFAFGWR